MNTVDLHTHSTCSDGSYNPTQLIAHAKSKGLSAVALTDHDTVSGLDEAIDAGKKYEVEVIPGIEFSTVYNEYDIHILGLLIDYKNKEFCQLLSKLRLSRLRRNELMLDNLNKLGIDIPQDKLGSAGNTVVSRAHIAKALVEKGYAKSSQQAFVKYLGAKTGMVYVKREKLSCQEAISAIHSAGGVAVIAHPNQISDDKSAVEMICTCLAAQKIDAIETYYCEYDEDYSLFCRGLAKRFGFLESGGSDFHGVYKEGLELGIGYGNLSIPYEILQRLKNRVR